MLDAQQLAAYFPLSLCHSRTACCLFKITLFKSKHLNPELPIVEYTDWENKTSIQVKRLKRDTLWSTEDNLAVSRFRWERRGVQGKGAVFSGLHRLTAASRINQLYSNRNDAGVIVSPLLLVLRVEMPSPGHSDSPHPTRTARAGSVSLTGSTGSALKVLFDVCCLYIPHSLSRYTWLTLLSRSLYESR